MTASTRTATPSTAKFEATDNQHYVEVCRTATEGVLNYKICSDANGQPVTWRDIQVAEAVGGFALQLSSDTDKRNDAGRSDTTLRVIMALIAAVLAGFGACVWAQELFPTPAARG